MNVAAFDYNADTICLKRGLALTASLIRKARDQVANCLLFDNGDFLQGSAMGDYIASTGLTPNPMIAAMNALGYDAVNLGNHEFSHGIEYLLGALRRADFPTISANVIRAGGQETLLPSHAILSRLVTDRQGQAQFLRIGVTGALPPATAQWDADSVHGLFRFDDILQALSRTVPKMRAQGADVVVVLAHSGIGLCDPPPMSENVGLAISRIPGIDAIVLGHVHQAFPNAETPVSLGVDPRNGRLNGVPTVMPGAMGSHLGLVDLRLEKRNSGWKVAGQKSEVWPVCIRDWQGATKPQVPADSAIQRIVRRAHDETRLWASRPITETREPIHTFFAMVSDSLAVRLIHAAQSDFVTKALADSRFRDLPVLSAAAPFKAGGRGGPDSFVNIAAGNILFRHLADLYSHPNTIAALEVTGRDIHHWLLQASQVFLTVGKGGIDQPLLNPDFPPFHFDTIAGVNYKIDLSAHASSAKRIRGLTFNGSPVRPDQRFILATTNFRQNGSGGFIAPTGRRKLLADTPSTREILMRYLQEHGATPPPSGPAWAFRPMPETTVIFETSPHAIDHLDELKALGAKPLGITSAGYLRVRLSL